MAETFLAVLVSNRSLQIRKASAAMGRLTDPTTAPAWHAGRSLLLIFGLLAAGLTAFLTFPIPYGHTLSWSRLLGTVFEQALVVSMVSVLTVGALSPLVLPSSGPDFLALVRCASINSLWLAPLALFVREGSFWTLPIAAVLSTVVTASIETTGETNSTEPLLSSIFTYDAIPLTSKLALQQSIFAAWCVEIGVLVALNGHVIWGALIVALCCAIWTWGSSNADSRSAAESSRSNPLLTLTLVALFMIAGLVPHLLHGGGRGFMTRHGMFPNRPAGGDSRAARSNVSTHLREGHPGEEGERGIILWGKEKSYTKLVAPSPILSSSLTSRGSAVPLVIPFDGVYWFYKSPDLRPPVGSQQAHTTPDVVDIRSTDRRPLSIEALDHLANLINLDCCSRFQIAIRNADRYPETVSLELQLVNTSLPHSPFVSLGQMMVSSTHPWKLYEKPGPVNETLSFPIPVHRTLRSFDEIKVIFLLDRARADAAARIAIDHFVMVPRGF